jgi:Gpi18-like mannosyltransferase
MKKVLEAIRTNPFVFIFTMWFLSRLLIAIAMGLLAPSVSMPASYAEPNVPLGFIAGHTPKPGWDLLAHWDGAWYRQIVTSGYTYAGTSQQSSIAFLPIFPLLVRGVMSFGLPFEVGGALVNNLAFLGALGLLYRWVAEQYNARIARWTTAAFAWIPFSLFGTVAYTEGLFLLLSMAALRSFDQGNYRWATLWGAIATATRVTGTVLIPTFLLVAWKQKRPTAAYLAGLASSTGLLLFMAYCFFRFGDPLAFVHVQKAFHVGYGLQAWLRILVLDKTGFIRLLNLLILLGSGCLLWYFRNKLSQIVVIYGFCSLALIMSRANSAGRYAYGIISLSIALGLLFSLHPRWGYAAIGFFAVCLAGFSIRFAWWQWVA